ncbi:MAG: c-type cytochrome [Alphaproteobacteria bacterium]
MRSDRRTLGRTAAAIAIACAALAGCDSLPGKPREADRPLRPSEVTDFATLWGQNCSGCHGADGNLGSATPLGSPVYLAAASDAAIRNATAAGIPGTSMPAFAISRGGSLTDQQIDLVVQGMRARWAAPVSPAPPSIDDATTGDPSRGAAVFAARCANCHGADGAGGPKAGSVVDPAYLQLVSDRGLRAATIAGRPDLGMPDWRGESGQRPLEAGEVADVVAWMASRRPAPIAAAPATTAPAATTTTRSDHVP